MKKNSITTGNIPLQLLLFFFPVVFGSFFQLLYNTSDAVVVGHFVSTEALAAVGGTTGTLINLFVGFFIGISSGCTVIIAQCYGGEKKQDVQECVHTAIAFSGIIGILLTGIGLISAPFCLSLMNVPKEILPDAVTYLRIYFLGMPVNLMYNMGAGIHRATGDSKRPLYFLICSCLTNIALDLIFVVVFKFGVAGAALATILSQLLSAVLVIRSLMSTTDMHRLDLRHIRIHKHQLRRMVFIGIPEGLQSIMYTSSNIIAQASVNTLGTNTIAAWTVYGKVDTLFWMAMQALGISMTTFISQNYGAQNRKRVRQGIRCSFLIAVCLTSVLSFTLYFFGGNIFQWFTANTEVIELGIQILRFMASNFFLYIMIQICTCALRATGENWSSMCITGICICLFRALWFVLAFPRYSNIMTAILCYPISWGLCSFVFVLYVVFISNLRRWLKNSSSPIL